MAMKIGFTANNNENADGGAVYTVSQQMSLPRRSVVQVYFVKTNTTLSYYNDLFDLHCGDLVYVEGKMEGMIGRVTDVNYNFKIKMSDYKRVISVVDTTVHGSFFTAGSHFVTFDRNALPVEKVIRWFKAPIKDDEEFVSGSDDSSFCIDDLGGMNIGTEIASRGHEYYMENKVRYICLDGIKGYAIVEGGQSYEVEFEYRDREISRLTCSCFCGYSCKHEFAVMLQLREVLDTLEKNYSEEYEQAGYFAVVNKATLFTFAIEGKDNCRFVL